MTWALTVAWLTRCPPAGIIRGAGPIAVWTGSEPQEILPDDRAWGFALSRVHCRASMVMTSTFDSSTAR